MPLQSPHSLRSVFCTLLVLQYIQWRVSILMWSAASVRNGNNGVDETLQRGVTVVAEDEFHQFRWEFGGPTGFPFTVDRTCVVSVI